MRKEILRPDDEPVAEWLDFVTLMFEVTLFISIALSGAFFIFGD